MQVELKQGAAEERCRRSCTKKGIFAKKKNDNMQQR